jgi:hypothetical protein
VHGILEFLGLIPRSTNVYTFTTALLHSPWLADRPKLNWDLQTESVIIEKFSSIFPKQAFYACVYCSMYNVLCTADFTAKRRTGDGNRARIFKRLWSPGIDSKECIPLACVAWRAGTITLFLPTRFLAPIDCLKIPAQTTEPFLSCKGPRH